MRFNALAESKALASIRVRAAAESIKSVPNLGIRLRALAESNAFASINVRATDESMKSLPNEGTVGI